MDPLEQNQTHSYPNADRKVGEEDTMPKTQTSIVMPTAEALEEKVTPIVHITDVIPEPIDNTTYKTSSVHTFKDDLASEASKGNFSIGKIMTANSARLHRANNGNEPIEFDKKNKHTAIKIIVPVVCILIVVIFSYIGLSSAKTPQQISEQKNPNQLIAGGILYTEQSLQIDISGKKRTDLITEINQSVLPTKIPVGKIKSIIFSYKNGSSTVPATSLDFLNIIAPSTPDILLRNINNEYTFGYYSYETNEPFIILRAANYDSVFAGMLEWERTMYADLGDIILKQGGVSNTNKNLPKEELTSTSTGTTTQSKTLSKATTTKAVVLSEYDTPFVDRVISNNDTRVLYRPNGDIAFFYTFFNKNTVIITTSEQTLREIIYRLTSGKITR